MTDQTKYALFSKAAYRMNDPLKHKQTRMDSAMSVIKEGGVTGFEMDRAESGSKRAVFVNKQTKEVVIAHRGTDPKLASNLSTDFAVALGLEGMTRRFSNAAEKDAGTQEKYKGYKVSLTGHSLGATIATHSSKQNNLKAYLFNAGSGILNPSHYIRTQKQNRNVTHFSTAADPLSLTAKFKPHKQVIVSRKPGNNPHSLDNFL
jgi:hypothetical protein